jgi:hypothetical protein
MNKDTIFPRTNSTSTVLLENIFIKNKNISIGDFTYYDDFVCSNAF